MAKIAIITRTKDRGIMLERAARSVSSQIYPDYVWIVVNDGGTSQPVDEIVSRSGVRDTVVIHHEINKGMEAASNAGLRHPVVQDCEYVVIHDDDDTWDPQFLAKSVDFLESENGSLFGGVVCGTVHVDETMTASAVEIVSRKVWQTSTGLYPEGAIQLADMSVGNQFPPISFLYRTALLEKVGLYDETLPVLGDWEFNLRFLMVSDIAVIPERLANYHHRIATSSGSANYGNSVSAGYLRHYQREAMIRNDIIRKSLTGGPRVMADLMISGRHHQTTRIYLHNARRIGDLIATGMRPLFATLKKTRHMFKK
jgi:glycosyltransferase involved in cell wall biosynthesis